MYRSPFSRGASAAIGLHSGPILTMSARDTSAGGIARGMLVINAELGEALAKTLSQIPSC